MCFLYAINFVVILAYQYPCYPKRCYDSAGKQRNICFVQSGCVVINIKIFVILLMLLGLFSGLLFFAFLRQERREAGGCDKEGTEQINIKFHVTRTFCFFIK